MDYWRFLNAESYLMQGIQQFDASIALAIELSRFYILEQRPDEARQILENLTSQYPQNALVMALLHCLKNHKRS